MIQFNMPREFEFPLKCKNEMYQRNRQCSNSRQKNGVFVQVIVFIQEDLSVALKCFSQVVTNFLLLSAENTKKSHVLNFNNHNSGSKHNFCHFLNILTPFFFIYSLSSSYLLIYLNFAFKELQNSISGVRHLPYVLVCKIHICLPKMTL